MGPLSLKATGGVEAAIAYHERTKHHPRRYALGPGAMDWANEPDPFRRYRGATLLPLDRPPPAPRPHYDAIFVPGDEVPARRVNGQSISQLFFDSLALSAWKEYRGARWSLRVNPSSGDLHPTEAYLIGEIPGLGEGPAVFHYCPREHALEVRLELRRESWSALRRRLPPGSLLCGFSSIYWRESWKYGERAFRYCQHDLGHAVAAVALSAGILGWECRLLEAVSNPDLAVLLGVHRQRDVEAEHAECLLAIYPRGPRQLSPQAQRAYRLPLDLMAVLAQGRWAGRRNHLSAEHESWPVINAVYRATLKDEPPARSFWASPIEGAVSLGDRGLPARRIIRRRRSALALDARSAIDRTAFYRMLQRVRPEASPVPFAALPWKPAVHLLLFVHRVTRLPPGLYLLVRDSHQRDDLRSAMTKRFQWRRPQACPEGLHLYLLQAGDCREAARLSSCHQEIAADGAFAVAMVATFEPRLAGHGAWFYRRLHWEAGVIGQVLYLEAEAAGIGSTGIGCFFDDVTHEILGVADRRCQTIYHFTIGAPVEDARLTSWPAYPPPPDA